MKVVIVGGGGGIGSSTAFNLLRARGTYEIVLVDTRPNMILSHTMDLENAAALLDTDSWARGGTTQDLADADLVVLAAAVPLRLNSSRTVFLRDNALVVDACLAPLRENGFGGVVLIQTNPVDPLLTYVHQQGWIDRTRLVGYTLNDSLRLRTGVAKALDVHPHTVDAWVIGEHGEGQVPLYDHLRVAGEPASLSAQERHLTDDYVDNWYSRHVALDSGRTSTWTTGFGTAAMIEAMALESERLWPASVVLSGEYGVDGVALSVPVRLDRHGVREIAAWDLDPVVREDFLRCAAVVRTWFEGLADLTVG